MEEAHTILLVEDEEIVALVAQSALRKEGFKVLSCADGQTALTFADSDQFSLLIADVNLPGGLDGIMLARKLRGKFPSLPVILTSGSYDGSQLVHEELGALLLPKPFRKSELMEKVQQLVSCASKKSRVNSI